MEETSLNPQTCLSYHACLQVVVQKHFKTDILGEGGNEGILYANLARFSDSPIP